jgi:predicted enzyme related to lactoylglutathione lyase
MQGSFFWYDVMTTDVKAGVKFYSDVVGWGTQDGSSPDMEYTIFTVKGQGVAGLMPLPEEVAQSGGQPAWMGYILVDDVDQMAGRIQKEGGTLHKGPITVPEIIRFAVVSDPQGAVFLIAKPLIKEGPPPPPMGTPGIIGWHELYAGEWQGAFAFYQKLFGWTKADALDMGPMATYQLVKSGGEMPLIGMMTKPPQVPRPFWGFYINVDGIDAAVSRINAGGGKVVNGPMEVPGGQWIVQAIDPQGAFFALVSLTR